MEMIKDKFGRKLLHIWRTGTAFEFTNKFIFYKEWNNIKFSSLKYPNSKTPILYFDVNQNLPFNDDEFDVIYCNHVLEHLTEQNGKIFCKELLRVLKKGGICRLVVPDLESTANEYLNTLNAVNTNPTKSSILRYEWAQANLIDQMVRDKPGGKMGDMLRQNQVDWDQIKKCNGDVFEKIKSRHENGSGNNMHTNIKSRLTNFYMKNGIRALIKEIWYRSLRKLKMFFSKKTIVELYNEKTLWMYDSFSLKYLMVQAGFSEVKVMDYKTSQIKHWNRYDFDKSEMGDRPLEPSVYVEGIKK